MEIWRPYRSRICATARKAIDNSTIEIMTNTALAAKDPILANIIATIPEPVVHSTQNVFFDLISCIVEQQIHYRSTKRIFQKLLDKAGLQTLHWEHFEDFEKVLPTIQLAASKYETLAHTLHFFENNGHIQWDQLSNAAVREILGGIKGVGAWSIDMILLYTLERPDIFPYDDFHLKNIMVQLYGLDAKTRLKAQMLAIANRWDGQSSQAVKYLLAYKNYQRGATIS